MEPSHNQQISIVTKVLWGAVFICAATVLVYSLSHFLEFRNGQYVELAVAVVITALLGQHEFRVPKLGASLRIREMAVFWAILSLGIPGGAIVAVCASISGSVTSRRSKWNATMRLASDTLAACFSAIVLYEFLLVFDKVTSHTGVQSANVFWLVAGASIMFSTHYLATVSLGYLSPTRLVLNPAERFKRNLSELAPTYALGAAGGVMLYLCFTFFGATFGWAVFPVAIAAHFAYRIYQERLEVKTRQVREASRVHLATVEALATAIDARDQVGMGHVRRTQIYALGLGEVLGLSESEMDALNIGALLHDIGKLAIPDHILNKPGKLTPAELEKTKIHPSVGAAILDRVAFESPVVPTVKYHHESWDGSGYPERLRGEQIPLTARILSVADAYDTLRGARPYRPPVGREEARRVLLNGAGIQFDPKIVDVFLRNLREFESKVEEAGLGYQMDDSESAAGEAPDSSTNGYVDQIKRANREVFTLYELARIFTASMNLDDTLTLFARKIRELVPFDTCAVFLFDDGGFESKAVYTEGKHATVLRDRLIRPGDGATGFALKKRQPVVNVNPNLDFSFGHQELIDEYTAIASLPLVANDRLLGAVTLYSCTLTRYEDEHVRLLETVSRMAADALLKSLYYAETESRALTDPMTGLPNARSLQSQFEKEVARANRKGTGFQVLMLDLDGFKAVNDTYGHKVGDQLLKGISSVMLGQLRDYDFLARYAGDEFVAIIPEAENRSVNDLCVRIEKAVENYELPVGGGNVAKVGVSLGAASYPQSGESLDQIIIAADKAMYRIKAFRKQQNKKTAPEPEGNERMVAVQIIDDAEATAVPTPLQEHDIIIEPDVVADGQFIIELDESHIVRHVN
jgi:diguanylate cyclase (GGDEF)-like protein/putative nucleotidyltransferase with HDIG domain